MEISADKRRDNMSKEKTPKIREKASAFDIVSRVITCLLAAAVPAALYFLNIIYYEFESTLLGLIGSLSGNEGDTGITVGYISINGIVKDILPLFKGDNPQVGTASDLWAAIEVIHKPLLVTGALLAVALVMVLAIFFTSCFSKSNKLPLIFSVIGFIASLSMAFAFRHATAPVVNGTLELTSTLLSIITGSMVDSSTVLAILNLLVSAASDYILKFTVINLSTGWVVMMLCFIAIAIWHGAQLLLTLGEDKKPKKTDVGN